MLELRNPFWETQPFKPEYGDFKSYIFKIAQVGPDINFAIQVVYKGLIMFENRLVISRHIMIKHHDGMLTLEIARKLHAKQLISIMIALMGRLFDEGCIRRK